MLEMHIFFSERKKYNGITEKIRRPVKREIKKKKLMVTELLLKKKTDLKSPTRRIIMIMPTRIKIV